MQFAWPHHLWWMLALPLLVALYFWLLRRRARVVMTLPRLDVARGAARRSWRRHVPPALVLLALALMLLALARPVAPLTLPWTQSTILLAMDVSRSMRVSDVRPTRMVAAQEAAKAFVAEVPAHVELGLVTFAGTAQVAQQATVDRAAVVQAIDSIQMQLGTAIGNAIVLCLAELFPEHGIDLGTMTFGPRADPDRGVGGSVRQTRPAPPAIAPASPGSYASAAIILLSDGRRTMGVDTLEAARMAADRGVRIHVVGLGTPDGHLAAGEGMGIYLQLDEATLRRVAEMTGGEYHHAASAEALRSVYVGLGARLQLSRRDTELTALLAGAAALLLALGTALSVRWFGRVA
jgi:Ca-activated chloride channel family protein